MLDRPHLQTVGERVTRRSAESEMADRDQAPAGASDRPPSRDGDRLRAGQRERGLAARNDAEQHAPIECEIAARGGADAIRRVAAR